MESNIISFRKFLIIIFFGLLSFIGYFYFTSKNNLTTVVFCDVGQGDATYIRIKNRFDLLIDAGPDKKVLSCLGKYMPFYDKKIELAIISHPQKDHFGGFLFLLDRYQIDKFLISPLDSSSLSFKLLKRKILEKKILVQTPLANDNYFLPGAILYFFWPTKNFLTKNLIFDNKNSSNILGVSALDDNNFSLVFLFQINNFKILFTGDATTKVLNEIALTYQSQLKTNILKIPHHGSKNGLTEKFLSLADPTLAVISVALKNTFGHPHKEIIDMLKAQKIEIKRTDKDGNIVLRF
jgi:competence protein ComEC